jgi:hypothetical protein
MTGTIHQAPRRPIREAGLTDTPADDAMLERTSASRTVWTTLRNLSLGAVVFLVSAIIGYLVMSWATHRGHGHHLTPLSVFLIVAVALAFAISEVVSVIRAHRGVRG